MMISIWQINDYEEYFTVPVASDSVELWKVELDVGLAEEEVEWDSADQWSRSEYFAVVVALSDSQYVPYRCGLSSAH